MISAGVSVSLSLLEFMSDILLSDSSQPLNEVSLCLQAIAKVLSNVTCLS